MKDDNDQVTAGVSRRKLLTGSAKAAMLAGFAGAAGGGAVGLGAFTRPAQAKEAGVDVRPGDLDEYYGFSSSGQTGEVRIIGLPSMRLMLKTTTQSRSADVISARVTPRSEL